MGHPYVFIDLHSLGSRDPVSVRLPKYDVNTIIGLDRIYDGIFFIDQMKRATRAA